MVLSRHAREEMSEGMANVRLRRRNEGAMIESFIAKVSPKRYVGCSLEDSIQNDLVLKSVLWAQTDYT
jgi:hypothetical protein